MPLEIHPATPDDAPRLSEIFFTAFTDPFSQRMFPPSTPEVHEWWTAKFIEDCTNPSSGDILLKVVDRDDASGQEVIAAFAIWNVPPADDPSAVNSIQLDLPKFPESSDRGLCEQFFGRMTELRERFVGGRRHYCMFHMHCLVGLGCFDMLILLIDLDMLGAHPDYHGRGIGSMLLKWGLDRADQEGLETYLSASPSGRPLYEKRGFKVLLTEEPCPGYQQAYMLRPKREDAGKQ